MGLTLGLTLERVLLVVPGQWAFDGNHLRERKAFQWAKAENERMNLFHGVAILSQWYYLLLGFWGIGRGASKLLVPILVFFHSETSKFSGLQQRPSIIPTFSVVQEFMCDLTRWFQLRVFPEVAIKMSARAALFWRLDRGWRIHFQVGSHTCLASWFWLLVGGLVSPHPSLSTGCVECPHVMVAYFPQRKWWGRKKKVEVILCRTVLQMSHSRMPSHCIC